MTIGIYDLPNELLFNIFEHVGAGKDRITLIKCMLVDKFISQICHRCLTKNIVFEEQRSPFVRSVVTGANFRVLEPFHNINDRGLQLYASVTAIPIGWPSSGVLLKTPDVEGKVKRICPGKMFVNCWIPAIRKVIIDLGQFVQGPPNWAQATQQWHKMIQLLPPENVTTLIANYRLEVPHEKVVDFVASLPSVEIIVYNAKQSPSWLPDVLQLANVHSFHWRVASHDIVTSGADLLETTSANRKDSALKVSLAVKTRIDRTAIEQLMRRLIKLDCVQELKLLCPQCPQCVNGLIADLAVQVKRAKLWANSPICLPHLRAITIVIPGIPYQRERGIEIVPEEILGELLRKSSNLENLEVVTGWDERWKHRGTDAVPQTVISKRDVWLMSKPLRNFRLRGGISAWATNTQFSNMLWHVLESCPHLKYLDMEIARCESERDSGHNTLELGFMTNPYANDGPKPLTNLELLNVIFRRPERKRRAMYYDKAMGGVLFEVTLSSLKEITWTGLFLVEYAGLFAED